MKTFEELGVCEEIRRAIEEMGFVQPMPVQENVIPVLLESRQDTIALAQTGTGKTAAFGIPLLQRVAPPSPPLGGRMDPADENKERRMNPADEHLYPPKGGQGGPWGLPLWYSRPPASSACR